MFGRALLSRAVRFLRIWGWKGGLQNRDLTALPHCTGLIGTRVGITERERVIHLEVDLIETYTCGTITERAIEQAGLAEAHRSRI